MLLFISIHAPTRGATNQAWIRAFGNSYFNPRSYKRSDFRLWCSKGCCFNFNPRSYKRSDPAACPLCCIPDIFQSTLLQEERPFLGIFAPDCCQFQSTLLQEERRVKCKNTEAPTMISIHAPTRGATSFRSVLYLNHSHFNPRSYKRSDCYA